MNTKQFQKTMITILIAATLLAACAPAGAGKKTISLEQLYSGTWHLVAYGYKDKTENVTPGLNTFIDFQPDGSLSGNAGCNNFFGSYKVSEKGRFSLVEPAGSTLMYCEGFMDEETAFMGALQSAKSFYFNENNQLVIKFKKSAEGFDYMLFENKQPPALLGTNWVLSSLVTPEGDVEIPSENAPLLNLSEDSGMTGYGGCNNIFSDYVAKDEKISFGPIASTRMYCEGLMELEGSFMRALDTVTQYKIIDNQLVLSDENLTTVLTFSASEFTLINTQWRLQSLNGEVIPADIEVTLTLSDEDAVFGIAGCNNYSGTYAVDADRLTVNILAVTAMYCEPSMAIEEAFIAAMQDELTFQIDNSRLTLSSKNNTLFFLAEE